MSCGYLIQMNFLLWNLKLKKKIAIQEWHSSRMCTIPCSSHLGVVGGLGVGVGGFFPEGVYPMGCLPAGRCLPAGGVSRGVSACQRGVCPRGVCLPRSVSACWGCLTGGCLPAGGRGVCLLGMSAWGWVVCLLEGVCLLGVSACWGWGCLPARGVCPGGVHLSPMDRILDSRL